ncbi:dynactin p62 family-domain-containing protein [Catenaria anguillulae PL171]|uniref:Dynactin subunit 4 n=1 Tax=Catenaria anguillulae PL171 TaxID=765915 RepID=A0A1Y2HEV5_9FUNG|nr:dynactin p62 family-domain-containing protein [Catenaria anguillulae PL171]
MNNDFVHGTGTGANANANAGTDFALPSIAYACSCSLTVAPLTALLFCPDCADSRCNRCVANEPTCYYCPLCLFEVPSSSVKNDRNRCARNCFECPVCRSALQVLADPSSASASTTSSSSDPSQPNPPTRHFLQCGFCRWDSRETNIVFDRATGLGGSLLKREQGSAFAQEFASLKADLERRLESSSRAPTSSSRISSPHLALLSPSFSSLQRHVPHLGSSRSSMSKLTSITGSSSKSVSTLGGSGGAGGNQSNPDPYRPMAPFDDTRDDRRVELMHDLQWVEDIPTLEQRLNQPMCDVLERLLPLRTHLRAKLAKRCRQCDKQLIKPEPKAQTTRFKIKHVALAHLPNITLAHPMPILVQNHPTTVLLRFTNPLDDDLQISLAALDSVFASVNLVCPQFSVPGFDETQQAYDEFEDPASLPPTMDAGMTPHGIVQVRGNSITVEVQVTPRGGLGSPVEFQLIVSYEVQVSGGSHHGSNDATPTSSPLVRRSSRMQARPASRTVNLAVTIVAGSVSSLAAFPM